MHMGVSAHTCVCVCVCVCVRVCVSGEQLQLLPRIYFTPSRSAHRSHLDSGTGGVTGEAL